MTEEELPELREGILSNNEVRTLLDDVERDGADVEVTVRRGRGEPVERYGEPDAARRALLPSHGSRSAAQLRYRLDGVAWCDTLIPTPDGFRLVRAQQ